MNSCFKTGTTGHASAAKHQADEKVLPALWAFLLFDPGLFAKGVRTLHFQSGNAVRGPAEATLLGPFRGQ
jgi:hypothetical protein